MFIKEIINIFYEYHHKLLIIFINMFHHYKNEKNIIKQLEISLTVTRSDVYVNFLIHLKSWILFIHLSFKCNHDLHVILSKIINTIEDNSNVELDSFVKQELFIDCYHVMEIYLLVENPFHGSIVFRDALRLFVAHCNIETPYFP